MLDFWFGALDLNFGSLILEFGCLIVAPPPVLPPVSAFGPRGLQSTWLLDFGIWDLWFGIVEFRRLGSLILVG